MADASRSADIRIRHVRQPRGSSLCGQACVAMLTGRPLEDAIELVGSERGTYAYELRGALKKAGLLMDHQHRRMPRDPSDLPAVSVAKMVFAPEKGRKTGRSHWVVLTKMRVYYPGRGYRTKVVLLDPELTRPYTVADWEDARESAEARLTSHYGVYRLERN